MNRDDLLKMLDLAGKDAASEMPDAGIDIAPAEPTPGASPTALRLDAWALRRGRELLD